MTKQYICIISGRVQGVLFRDFTCRTAKKFGVTGTVENLPDGTVRVVAEGDETKLKELIAKLKIGNLLAKVSDIKISKDSPCLKQFSDFKIVYHGFLDHF